MLYYLGSWLVYQFGRETPDQLLSFFDSFLLNIGRLLSSYAVLIISAMFVGFILTQKLLPKFYDILPHDRGRDFTLSKEVSKGKPTGSGVVFISFFVLLSFIFFPLDWLESGIIILTWFMMLTGYLDDRSKNGWGEYIKALLDLIICVAASFLLAFILKREDAAGRIFFWLPFIKNPIAVPMWLFIIISTIMLWVSVNTTNCTDGVDGLSSSLVLIGLFTMGALLYLVIGHKDIAAYLYVPHLSSGAIWGAVTFTLSAVLMGYLWHNAFPSNVLMGDAGSRALGFFIGVTVMLSGNPFLFLATSSIIFVNGGLGLLKVALKRFLHISILENIRFPLHDHMRKNRGWSPTQVLIKFMILQILITITLLGAFFKIR